MVEQLLLKKDFSSIAFCRMISLHNFLKVFRFWEWAKIKTHDPLSTTEIPILSLSFGCIFH